MSSAGERGADGATATHVEVRGLTMAYGDFVVQRDLDFTIQRGDIFIIMGGSGCGKSTLLKHLVGLMAPAKGQVLYSGTDFWAADPDDRELLMRRFGILFQSGALWSSMTLAENVARLILTEFGIAWVRVTVSKPGAVRGSRDVGVIIERTRADLDA